MSERGSEFPELVELNVGGVFYTTYISTLTREKESLLGQLFNGTSKSKIVNTLQK
jgi:hypothetical protein